MVGVKELDEVGVRLVDEAGRLLTAEGLAGLSLRRLASRAETSTMAVYTRFGDKDGLLAAMHAEGFRRLGAALQHAAAREPDDALEALLDMGLAYRQAALDSPHLYQLMFGAAAPSFQPHEDGRAVADAAYEPLVSGVRRALETGALTDAGGDAERIALYLWSVSHGFVSLEISRKLDTVPADAAYRDAMVLAAVPFLPG